jgi:hypothetical protein
LPPTIETATGRACARCGKPVHQTESGEWRCTACRSDERSRQRANKGYRAEQAARHGWDLKRLTQRAEAGETLTDDEWQQLVADNPDGWDFEQDWRLWIASGAWAPTDEQLRQADALFATGSARRILDRAGMTITRFAANTGAGKRALYLWLNGQPPKSAKARPAVAIGLAVLQATNDESDATLKAHGLPTTSAAQRDFEANHPALALDNPARHCDGCARTQRALRTIRHRWA